MKINTIYNEDCLETMSRMPDEFIDLVVTSPPYDNLRTYKGYTFDFRQTARSLFRVVKQGGVVVWVVGDQTIDGSETGSSFKQALWFKYVGFSLHDTMIYLKAGVPFPEQNRYCQAFEFMFVVSKGKPQTTNIISDRANVTVGRFTSGGSRLNDGSIRPKTRAQIKDIGPRYNCWYLPNQSRGLATQNHPATFPEALAKDHIISWSNEGDLVYDPFMGSGTTAKMCKLTNRKYIGSEISAEYCAIAERRIAETEVQEALRFG